MAPPVTTPCHPSRVGGKPQRKCRRDGKARRLRLSDVGMDEGPAEVQEQLEEEKQEKEQEIPVVEPAESSGRASPVLTKALFGAGDYDSSSGGEEDEDEDGGARRTSYRSRSRRLSGLTHPARASAPEVAYTIVTPMKANRAAARRRQSLEISRAAAMVSGVKQFGSPLPVEKPQRTPMKRVKVPFPSLFSPVPVDPRNKRPLLGSPSKSTPPTDTTDHNMSVCSTMSTCSPWDSPLGKKGEAESMAVNVSFKSPVPPTPLKHRATTPSRQKFLNKKEVLVQVRYPSDSPGVSPAAFGELETVGWLGAGVSAEVLKVFSRKQNLYFAVKKTKHELRSERERDVLLQEIVIAEHIAASGASFDHIARYYQAWQDEGFLFVQTELCVGGNMRDFIAFCDGRMIPEDCLWTILNHVANGLAVLHANGIIHLDIKPENVFITSDGVLKIGDLGMAAEKSSQVKRVDDLEGDAVYMAKELLSATERLPSADIFCLGIMMLELATGIELPSSGDEWHALREGYLPPFPEQYTPDIGSAIAQMMHPDPSTRPTATEIANYPHIRARSAPADLVLEHAQHYSSVAVKNTLNTSRSSLSETPRKPRLSVSLFE